MQSDVETSATENLWRELSPALDNTMARLKTAERDALVLRYFQNKSMAEVGQALGLAENTAQKRVGRALEKLRHFFAAHGVNSTADGIAETISIHSAQAASATLANSVVAVALTKGATASASTVTLINGALKIMAWTKAKTAMVAATALILAAGTAVVVVEETTTAGSDHSSVVLQLGWQPGKKYVMRKEDIQTLELKYAGQIKPVKQVQKQTMDLAYMPVRKLDNGGWQLQLEFESLTLVVSNGNRRAFVADSTQSPAQDAQNSLGARYRKMVGGRLEYFTDANRKVERMNGYQELINRVAGNDPREQAAFKDSFDEISLEKFGSVGEDTVPSRTVSVGDRWVVSMNAPSNVGSLQVNIECRFKNWEQRANRRCAHIVFTGTLSSDAVPDISTLRAKIEKGKITGEFWFDPELGGAVESTENIDAQLKINQNGQIQTVPFNEKNRVTMISVEDV